MFCILLSTSDKDRQLHGLMIIVLCSLELLGLNDNSNFYHLKATLSVIDTKMF